ncbi:10655_t:CDS:2 [Funneliformis caledonium]|uniref:10655_t:CDS:1 n=1 Tax=Funneliformis caledonium TaxID=1117310 RepID=A0A9N8YJC3_9GLOM|nr:10655_t:CDS:2 [Funneliformis caledonium]
MNNYEKGRQLENETVRTLTEVGIDNEHKGGPGDGGIDVSGVVAGIAYVIQCKNWACKIGRKVVDEFFGVVYRQKNNPIGIIVAPSGYYPGAVDAALEYGIILTDNANLVEVFSTPWNFG